jgi:hypothetical protein
MTKLKKWLIALAASLFLLGACLYTLPFMLGARFFVSRVAEFDRMPADDKLLESWLLAQPGVAREQLTICRDGRKLFILFGIDRTFRGQPPLPDLDEACRRLGYSGKTRAFEDYHGPLPSTPEAKESARQANEASKRFRAMQPQDPAPRDR